MIGALLNIFLVLFVLLSFTSGFSISVFGRELGGSFFSLNPSYFFLCFIVLYLYASIRGRKFFTLELNYNYFTFGFFILLFSNFVLRRFSFYSGDSVFFDAISFGFVISIIVLIYKRFLIKYFRQETLLVIVLLLSLQAYFSYLFLNYSAGRLIFSDDHPSFLYRIELLKRFFPNIPFYSTDWNAGYSAREFYPSGMLNIFFAAYPLISQFDLSNIYSASDYTLLIPYLYIFLVPLAVFFSCFVFGLSRRAAIIAAILALGPSMGFFEWLLKYGTQGFSFAAGVLPLSFAYAYKVGVSSKKVSWLDLVLLLIFSFFSLTWSLCAFVFLPVFILSLFSGKLFKRDNLIKIFVFAFAFISLHSLWVPTFFEESKVFSFIQGAELPGSKKQEIHSNVTHTDSSSRAKLDVKFAKAKKHFMASMQKINPLIVIFFIPGIMLLEKNLRKVFFATCLWLMILSFLGTMFKPQLELLRMLIVFAFLACVPVSLVCDTALKRLLETNKLSFSSLITFLSFVVISGGFVLSPINVSYAYTNRSDEHFIFAPNEFYELAEGIRINGGNGRTFVSGFILQELGAQSYNSQEGGHIAPLAMYANKGMYAFGYYHNLWSTVDPIPNSFRKRGEEGIEEFLDLINATAVISHKREWVNYFQNRSWYKEVLKTGRFRIFKRLEREDKKHSFVLSGDAEVKVYQNRINVFAKSKEVILKFRHLPKLKAKPQEGVSLEPYYVFTEELGVSKTRDVYFIKVVFEQEKPREISISY